MQQRSRDSGVRPVFYLSVCLSVVRGPSSLMDMIQAALMLKYNGRKIG